MVQIPGPIIICRPLQQAGLTVRVDRIGNVIGRIAAERPEPTVAVGSHVDSVPHGG